MNDCPYCNIKCPFVIKEQCAIRKIWKDTEALEKLGRDLNAVHVVNTDKISRN